jgi:methionyl-tRNA synthetase
MHTPPFYITTAIPYVNARPHLGFALEIVLTDALARYHRLRGEDTRFLTGSDENSLKNVQAAEREGLPTAALVERNSGHFYALGDALNLSFDDFIRTSVDERHLAGARKLWQACERSGDIYKRAYRGLYCVGCEQFYTEAELVDGLCPEHRTPPEPVEEENYFFRLSRYAAQLEQLIESDRLQIIPRARKNEVLSFIRGGLEDFSISRSQARARGWGIPVPGDERQVLYVWFDALANYITAPGYADEGPLYRRYWSENPRRVHVIGKGIIRFHAVYWPAMLLSAGVPLPSTIFVHGYVTVGREKISKSLGNVVDPVELAARYGADALRYYLLRQIPATEDGDFTAERFVGVYNADLADQLGNLLNRTLNMVSRYYGGVVPAPGPPAADSPLAELGARLRGRLEEALDRYAPHEALDAIWELVAAANRYVAEQQPWALAKRRALEGADAAAEERLAAVLALLVEALRLAAHACAPFLPATAEAIAHQLGTQLAGPGAWPAALDWGHYLTGAQVRPGGVLFPKHDL